MRMAVLCFTLCLVCDAARGQEKKPGQKFPAPLTSAVLAEMPFDTEFRVEGGMQDFCEFDRFEVNWTLVTRRAYTGNEICNWLDRFEVKFWRDGEDRSQVLVYKTKLQFDASFKSRDHLQANGLEKDEEFRIRFLMPKQDVQEMLVKRKVVKASIEERKK